MWQPKVMFVYFMMFFFILFYLGLIGWPIKETLLTNQLKILCFLVFSSIPALVYNYMSLINDFILN